MRVYNFKGDIMIKGKAIYIGNSVPNKLPVLDLNSGVAHNTANIGYSIDSNRLGRIIFVSDDGLGRFIPYGMDHLLVTVNSDFIRMISDEDFASI